MMEVETYAQGKRPSLYEGREVVSIDVAEEADSDFAEALRRGLEGIGSCSLVYGFSTKVVTRGDLYVQHDPSGGARLLTYLRKGKGGISFVSFNFPQPESLTRSGPLRVFTCEGDDFEALVSIIREVIVEQPDTPDFSSQLANDLVRDMARKIVESINDWLGNRGNMTNVRGIKIVSVRTISRGRRPMGLHAKFLKKGLEIKGSLWAVLV